MDTDLPAIRVHTPDHSKILKVISVWTETWHKTANYLKGQLDAAEAADIMNSVFNMDQEIEYQCDCDETTKWDRFHACGGCGIMTCCAKLITCEFNCMRICPRCYTLDEYSKTEIVKKRIHRLCGLEGSDAKEIFKELQDSKDWIDWLNFPDKYAPGIVRRQMGYRDGVNDQDPFQPCLDAILPYHRALDGSLGIHVPGNVAMTALYLNNACNTFPKGTINVVARYLRGELGQTSLNESMRAIHLLCMKMPWRRHDRLKQSVSESDFELMREEWRTIGSKTMPNAPRNAKFNHRISRALPDPDSVSDSRLGRKLDSSFRPNSFHRFQRIVSQLEEGSVNKLPRSADGCPYPFDETFMPIDWSWLQAWSYFGQKINV